MSRSGAPTPVGGHLRLDTPINFLKGIGPARAESLRKLGIITAGDLLWHVPRRYEDASTVQRISSLEPGMDATVVGRVISKGVIPTRKGLRIFQAVVRDESGIIEVSWPGQPFLDRVIQKDDVLLLSGPVRFFHGRQLAPREYVNLGADENPTSGGRVLSVYPATEGISFKVLRSLIETHLDTLLPLVEDQLPEAIRRRAGVLELGSALRLVHRPRTLAEAEKGRERMAFDELFFVQLLQRRANRLAREARGGITFENRRQLTTSLRASLPYTLTGAQAHALREIVADMCSPRRMHRLLQGDVGSGKTIVALFAGLLALENGYKAALMAPTELLAEQHARTFTTLLAPLGISPVLLTGSMGPRERSAALRQMAAEEPAFVVGTHALVQESARFNRLGFVAVDEQHRFGVEQREAIGSKGDAPDTLLMSATPIPRSLALTTYGDLDVSTLDERPAGRQPVTTVSRAESSRERVFSFVRRQVEVGRQAYIVYPVIEESEKMDLRAATVMFDHLSATVFGDLRLALLHGRVPSDERDRVMREFRDGQIDILVATTVIEVGIDVPNATVMLIEHPERFGLSQLHQLRGRVGRGAAASYCILLGDVGDESAERLSIFTSTEDGFEIARHDLRLRGMGDLFGQRQSGEPMFTVADPMRDESLNLVARAEAEKLLEADPDLLAAENAAIKRVLTSRYSRAMELFRVG
ncbi:MAG: ATP-dependent DNA helicase RecG [Gemmatimonadota bacterium]|nr:ATP-dependent DNA helicase RecG [Gemmatimonadota bacterium]